jgi:hypothetical protein
MSCGWRSLEVNSFFEKARSGVDHEILANLNNSDFFLGNRKRVDCGYAHQSRDRMSAVGSWCLQ